ncbi:hypothetical protein BDZ91DRAFT_315185 [Kalaharituber pfeilii]|nr:hypothetical protein BDZ91DRAFT_315185 [Kalaharituber pfeilii]
MNKCEEDVVVGLYYNAGRIGGLTKGKGTGVCYCREDEHMDINILVQQSDCPHAYCMLACREFGNKQMMSLSYNLCITLMQLCWSRLVFVFCAIICRRAVLELETLFMNGLIDDDESTPPLNAMWL